MTAARSGPTIGPFAGFGPAAFAFYAELDQEGNNDRAWFDAHRDVYEREVRVPLEALLARAAAEFGEDGKVFRPNRDVRFSADKRPYKTHAGAVIDHRTGTDAPVRYLQLDAEGLLVASGYHELSRDQLARFRTAVDDPRRGGALVRAVGRVRAAGLEVAGSTLTRAPRGIPIDHPRIALLRHTSLTTRRRFPHAGWMGTPEAYERIAEAWRASAPIDRWLVRHVGAPAEAIARRPSRGRR